MTRAAVTALPTDGTTTTHNLGNMRHALCYRKVIPEEVSCTDDGLGAMLAMRRGRGRTR